MPAFVIPMESLILPLMLLAGTEAAETVSVPVARSQATATARIIRGEQIRFGSSAEASPENGAAGNEASHVLPLARSNRSAQQKDSGELHLVEFY